MVTFLSFHAANSVVIGEQVGLVAGKNPFGTIWVDIFTPWITAPKGFQNL